MPGVFHPFAIKPILPTEDTFRLKIEHKFTSLPVTIGKSAVYLLFFARVWTPIRRTKSNRSIAIAVLALVVLTTRLLKG